MAALPGAGCPGGSAPQGSIPGDGGPQCPQLLGSAWSLRSWGKQQPVSLAGVNPRAVPTPIPAGLQVLVEPPQRGHPYGATSKVTVLNLIIDFICSFALCCRSSCQID